MTLPEKLRDFADDFEQQTGSGTKADLVRQGAAELEALQVALEEARGVARQFDASTSSLYGCHFCNRSGRSDPHDTKCPTRVVASWSAPQKGEVGNG
jgi:hypothetical protein